ncbi:MAG: alkaline phosphatase D family protein [Reyranellaceae bacterium]
MKDGKVGPAYYFRLQREFDRTGTFVLGSDVALGRHEVDGLPPDQQDKPTELSPDTTYTVRMATFTLDDPLPDAESIDDAELAKYLPRIENLAPALMQMPAEQCEVTIRTFPDPATRQDKVSFLLGSCRYPGLMWKIKEADRIFGPMIEHFIDETKPRFTLMVGDQIYADKFNRALPLGRADTYAEFQERYLTAYSSPNMRQLLRTAPTYMILDDHEIEDNWTQDRIKDSRQLFNIAIGAYMSYQWSHGPRSYGRRLFYNFLCGGYPFFVLDTRTQRYRNEEGLNDNHLLGRPTLDPSHPGQLQILLDWLKEQQRERNNTPKFIVSSSVFCPNSIDERVEPSTGEELLFHANAKRRNDSDSWPAFPQTRRTLLDAIVKHRIQNVVFLTGDIHCSNIASMDFTVGGNNPGIYAYDITSSAFYWPFPFADGDPNNYVHDSRLDGQRDPFPIEGGEMNYRSWAFTQEDNFCRIQIDKPGQVLRVRYYDRFGKMLDVVGPVSEGEQVLPLVPWT